MFISDEFFFGLHFMVDGYGAPTDVLRDEKRFLEALQAVPLALGMHTISAPLVLEVGPNNAKDPGGLSGFVLIAESHISFHTFPERGFVTIDAYTCKDELDTVSLLYELKCVFKFREEETHLIKRGRKFPNLNSIFT